MGTLHRVVVAVAAPPAVVPAARFITFGRLVRWHASGRIRSKGCLRPHASGAPWVARLVP